MSMYGVSDEEQGRCLLSSNKGLYVIIATLIFRFNSDIVLDGDW